jgi:predicted alpha/beta superfamily hydrolase
MTLQCLSLPPESPVTVAGAIQFDMASKTCGATFRIFVFEPAAPPPETGFPVVTTLDGNLTFPPMAAMDGAFGLGGGPSALVVGVGYPTSDPQELRRLRARDLTPAAAASDAPERFAECGGAEAFHRFLVEELRPAIADAFQVNDADQTLYGHSLAGLFTLCALFDHPGSFRNFVASSPAIWWDDGALLKRAPDFSARTAPRVLITVGATEQTVPVVLPPGTTREAFAQVLRDARMVDNARQLADRLRRAAEGYEVRFQAFDDDDHITALSTSIGRALAFALRP